MTEEPRREPGVEAPRRHRRRPPPLPAGSSPGALQVDAEARPTRLSAIGFGPDGMVEKNPIAIDELAALRGQWPVVWLDVVGFHDVELLRRIGELFGLHRLALADVLDRHQRAKVADYGTHEFLLLRMIDAGNPIETEQLGVFVGAGFVLTFQEREGDCFGLVRQRIGDAAGQIRKRGSDYLAYALLDAVVDAYFPPVEQIDVRLEACEERILAGRVSPAMLGQLHAVRRHLLVLRRAIWPLREATSSLVRGEVKHFSPEVQPYLRDVHDHLVQLLDLLETYRETCSSLMDLQMTSVNHRLNEVMKLLTIISTIFIPLTFVVGIYGMNFEDMPELKTWWGYPAVLLVMAAIAACMLVWFRKRRWL